MYSRDSSTRQLKNANIAEGANQFKSRGNVYRSQRAGASAESRSAQKQEAVNSNYNVNAAQTRRNPPPDYSGTAIRYVKDITYNEDTVSRYPIQNESESEFDYESDIAFPFDREGEEKTRENVSQFQTTSMPLNPIIHSRRSSTKDSAQELTQKTVAEKADDSKVDDMIKLLKNADIDGEDLLLCAIIIMLLSSGCEEEIIMILAFLLFSPK